MRIVHLSRRTHIEFHKWNVYLDGIRSFGLVSFGLGLLDLRSFGLGTFRLVA